MEQLLSYFPDLTQTQKERFAALNELYHSWNEKINVISRKDIDNLYEHHILHSLSIAKIINFKDNTSFIDVGTGGGFPGIPMAILLENCQFLLVDSIGKKVKVAQEVASALNLQNVQTLHARMEEVKTKADFCISRAVMPLNDLVKIVRKNISHDSVNALPNGLICLKGGELEQEVKQYKNIATLFGVDEFYKEEYFQTKKIVYLPL